MYLKFSAQFKEHKFIMLSTKIKYGKVNYNA